MDEIGEPRFLVHLDGCYQVKPQQREVGQVVLCEFFPVEVRVDAAQSSETVLRNTGTAEVGHLDALRIAHHHVLDLSFAIYEDADLSASLMRNFRHLPCELGGDDLVGRSTARAQLLDLAELALFEAFGETVDATDEGITSEKPSISR